MKAEKLLKVTENMYKIDYIYLTLKDSSSHGGRDRMVVGFTTTYAISAITTKVVSSNPVHG